MFVKYERDPMYMVNKSGDVLSLFTGLLLKPSLLANGYYHVNVRNEKGQRRPVAIHRMVAECFLGFDGQRKHVNHKDGNKLNNCVENLEWCTNAENRSHAKHLGLVARGDSHGKSSVTEAVVHEICGMFQSGMSATEVRKALADKDIQVSRGMLYNIRSRRDWSYISEGYDWPKRNTINKRSKRATTISQESTPK